MSAINPWFDPVMQSFDMKLAWLTEDMAVAPQLTVADIEEAAAAGVKTIINNRPDGEGFGQPPSAELRAAAEAAGIAFHDIPMQGTTLTPENIAASQAVIASLEGKAVFFCRSGARSAVLWAAAQAPFIGVDAALQAAAEVGFDLSVLRPILEQRSA